MSRRTRAPGEKTKRPDFHPASHTHTLWNEIPFWELLGRAGDSAELDGTTLVQIWITSSHHYGGHGWTGRSHKVTLGPTKKRAGLASGPHTLSRTILDAPFSLAALASQPHLMARYYPGTRFPPVPNTGDKRSGRRVRGEGERIGRQPVLGCFQSNQRLVGSHIRNSKSEAFRISGLGLRISFRPTPVPPETAKNPRACFNLLCEKVMPWRGAPWPLPPSGTGPAAFRRCGVCRCARFRS